MPKLHASYEDEKSRNPKMEKQPALSLPRSRTEIPEQRTEHPKMVRKYCWELSTCGKFVPCILTILSPVRKINHVKRSTKSWSNSIPYSFVWIWTGWWHVEAISHLSPSKFVAYYKEKHFPLLTTLDEPITSKPESTLQETCCKKQKQELHWQMT